MTESKRHIVICLDTSEGSSHAFDYAKGNVVRDGDHITLVGVAVPQFTPDADVGLDMDEGAGLIPDDNQIQAAKMTAHKVLEDLLTKYMTVLTDGFTCSVDAKVLPVEQGVGETVVAFVNKEAPNQVVVGSRGLGPVKRTLMNLVGLGSVSDYIVHHSHCPVLIVRPGPDALEEQGDVAKAD